LFAPDLFGKPLHIFPDHAFSLLAGRSYQMRVQFVGCGDAFGSGGRQNTVAEAHTFEKDVRNHLSLKTLEAHLEEIRPKRLILTDMSDDMLSRPDGLVHSAAHVGMIVEI